MNPKVSICIPAYRQPVFLRRTLESVLIQSFTDYEVIIADDTPDDSVAEVVSNCKSDARVRYYRNHETLGSPANWNETVRHASGEYIKILHHDDWFSGSESLSTYVRLLDGNPKADFAFSATVVSSVKNAARVHSPTTRQLQCLSENPAMLFYGNVVGAPSATIYRRTVCIEYDVNLKWLVDVDFYVRLLMRNSQFAYSSEPLICTTDEAPHQVTNECLANKDLLLFEYMHLYKKIFDLDRYDFRQLRLFWNLLGRYDVSSAEEIFKAGVSEPLPAVVLKVISLRKVLGWFKR